jgi:hypothetical protein
MKTLLLALSLLILSVVAHSQTSTPRASTRQQAQRTRIADGRQDGALTKRETTALRAEQRHIRRTERRAKADGTITRAERKMLEQKQDRASRHIHRAKTNEKGQ